MVSHRAFSAFLLVSDAWLGNVDRLDGRTQVERGGISRLSFLRVVRSEISQPLSRVWCLSVRLRLLNFARSLTSKWISILSVAYSSKVLIGIALFVF